ncbi:MAG: DUF721 domain-containing protein [Thiobacillus sp.]|nr:DUF721 domain-containing protein [Thiobacillus sp.]
MSAERLADLLARQMPQDVAARAQSLLKLQAALDRVLTAPLVGHVRVQTFEGGVLSLACASGAIASRLRHDTDAMILALGKLGLPVVKVRSIVDPALLARYVPPVDKPGLPTAALDGLSQLNASIEEGPLKDALTRLLRHHAPDCRG